ncbi:hypothetical protein C0Z17_07225 [Trinickia caryophylli]|nr:hypothetical protein C0Z17_07225 [Trinickia caryophylli]
MNKCQWGVPPGFTNADAALAVTNADFSNAVFVQTSGTGVTKKAYTYYEVNGFRICVVGDVHKNDVSGQWNIAGNSFIPGWTGWSLQTPAAQVAVIGPLQDGGAFPDDDRYPHPVI